MHVIAKVDMVPGARDFRLMKRTMVDAIVDMGEYNKNVNSIELAVALKDAGKTLEIMDLLMSNIDTLTDYTKSDLFEHMTFNNQMQSAASMVISTMLKQWDEEDAYQFVRESAGWEEFKKKWIN